MTQNELNFTGSRPLQFRRKQRELKTVERIVAQYLDNHARGRGNAVHIQRISSYFNIDYRRVKTIISDLVREFRANIGSHESCGVFVIQDDMKDWELAERSMTAHIRSRVHRLIMLRDPQRAKELLGQMIDAIVFEEFTKDFFPQ